jgi:hypothetical protein
MSFENIITNIENAHQDAITTFDTLEDLLFSEEDVEVTLSDGITRTVKSYKNLQEGIYERLVAGDYTVLDDVDGNNIFTKLVITTEEDYEPYADYIKFVSGQSAVSPTGSPISPFETIAEAIEDLNGSFGIIFLNSTTADGSSEQVHSIQKKYSNGSGDVIINGKVIVFDSYYYDVSNQLYFGTNIPSSRLAILQPASPNDSKLSCRVDKKVVDVFKKYKDDTNSLYNVNYTEADFDGLITTEQERPYIYSFVLKNSSVIMNNVKITSNIETSNVLSNHGTGNNIYFSSFDETISSFTFRPLPALFKDFYAKLNISDGAITGSATLTNENYFTNNVNNITMNNVKLYLSNWMPVLYFNNILDNSIQYKVRMINSSQEVFSSDTFNNVYYKYAPLVYIENNRIKETDTINGTNQNFYNTTFYNETDTLYYPEMMKKKYALNIKLENHLVSRYLTNGNYGNGDSVTSGTDYINQDSDTYFDTVGGVRNETSLDYLNSFAGNLFRIVETYVQVLSNQTNTFITAYPSQNYQNEETYDKNMQNLFDSIQDIYINGTGGSISYVGFRMMYIFVTSTSISLDQAGVANLFNQDFNILLPVNNSSPVVRRQP